VGREVLIQVDKTGAAIVMAQFQGVEKADSDFLIERRK
jgi:hypothetical protein